MKDKKENRLNNLCKRYNEAGISKCNITDCISNRNSTRCTKCMLVTSLHANS